MPTPEARADRQTAAEWRVYADRELHRLRIQFIWLLVFLLCVTILLAVRTELTINAVKLDRYLACQQRVVDLTAYNKQLVAAKQLPQPLPNCPPDPRG